MAAASAAVITGIFLSINISFRFLYLIVTFLLIALVLITVFGNVFSIERQQTDIPSGVSTDKKISLYRHPLILMLALITMLGFFGESALSSWSVIYIRGSLDLPTLLGASSVAVFHISMAIGRVMAGAAVVRFSRRIVLTAAGLTTAVGMSVALATQQAAPILFGFVLVGLGLAVVAPIVFSIAGDIAPKRAGRPPLSFRSLVMADFS